VGYLVFHKQARSPQGEIALQISDYIAYWSYWYCDSTTDGSLASNDDDDDSLRQLVTSQRSHSSLRRRHTALRAPGHGTHLPLTCGRPVLPPSGARIVGGDESRPRSWPWQIALRNRNARSSRCAGSLIAAQWVLTTAHCVDQLVPHCTSYLLFLSDVYPLCIKHILTNPNPTHCHHTLAQ